MYCHGWKLEKCSSQEGVQEREKKRVEVSAAVERGVDCFFILVSS
jgi:hypothetical protein